MKIGDMFPSEYLHGDELRGPVQVVIAGVERTEFYRPGEGKVTAWLLCIERATKKIVLSRTLATQISECLGSDDTANWGGKQVILFPQEIMVAGQKRVAIRARSAQPVQAGNNGDGAKKELKES